MSRLVTIGSLAFLSFTTLSCTSSLDLNRFHKDQAATTAPAAGSLQYLNVGFNATQMTSHINEYFEMRVVDKANNVAMKAVYFGVTNPTFSLTMPKALPKLKPPYRLDFWADHNRTGTYDGVEGGINVSDHAWRRRLDDPLPEDITAKADGTGFDLNFLHDTVFTDIFTDLDGNRIAGKELGKPEQEVLLPFNLAISGGQAYAGKMLEVIVTEQSSGRLIAIHRRGSVQDAYGAQVTGVCDEETKYSIAAYVDADGSGTYTTGDPSWNLDIVSGNDGVNGTLNLATAPQSPIVSGGTPAPAAPATP